MEDATTPINFSTIQLISVLADVINSYAKFSMKNSALLNNALAGLMKITLMFVQLLHD